INIILAVLVVVSLVAGIVIIATDNKPATIVQESAESDKASGESVQIDEFKAGTYANIEFKTVEDVVKYYVEAYNKTKAKTATY
ncbi:hypothetical protein RFX30_10805, partial [Acinetobacter baumannii]|nr:hypothetical protein [Acinetobacter baumannii]